MKIQEGALGAAYACMTLGEAVPGDVVNIQGRSGNPYLVVDLQDYELFVFRSQEYNQTSDNSVVVVSLRDSRLRKLADSTGIDYIKAEVHTE